MSNKKSISRPKKTFLVSSRFRLITNRRPNVLIDATKPSKIYMVKTYPNPRKTPQSTCPTLQAPKRKLRNLLPKKLSRKTMESQR